MRRRIVGLLLRITGWTVDGAFPPVPKLVVIGAPHTTNWDFIAFLAAKWYHDVRLSFMGKASLFRPPFGWLMRRLGGIPIERDESHSVVAAMADRFAATDHLWLVVAPEGTRGRQETWRSGFYRIAEAASVPILLAGVDFAQRRVVIGPTVQPSGDINADMDVIRAFYGDMSGKHPESASVIRLDAEG